jgi:acyl carrier protein
MNDVQTRLADCFAAVFPTLTPEEIRRATPESAEAWDSLAIATLVAVVEEEFGIPVDPEDMNRFISFQEVLAYVQNRLEAGESR